ncbi:hypothetical protein B0H13DRAFT_1857015 [Mycena leptocephala]|nr:hypothetical protein B0H13DRAFT_1857015 [Mycena leptocephala]
MEGAEPSTGAEFGSPRSSRVAVRMLTKTATYSEKFAAPAADSGRSRRQMGTGRDWNLSESVATGKYLQTDNCAVSPCVCIWETILYRLGPYRRKNLGFNRPPPLNKSQRQNGHQKIYALEICGTDGDSGKLPSEYDSLEMDLSCLFLPSSQLENGRTPDAHPAANEKLSSNASEGRMEKGQQADSRRHHRDNTVFKNGSSPFSHFFWPTLWLAIGASWSLKQIERRVFALLALTEPRPDSV